MITVIDYGAGNLRSVENALQQLGVEHRVTSKASDIDSASALLLPGVGHFGQMIRSLETLDVISRLRRAIQNGVPYLGICLGMQALYEQSEEAPACEGLGIFPGVIRRFPESALLGVPAPLKVPHMGWNQLNIAPGRRLFEGIRGTPFMYFAHSYYLPAIGASEPAKAIPEAAAEVDYGTRFVAAIEKENVYGVQFHPEKSGDAGLKVLDNFALVCSQPQAGALRGGNDAR